jgi:hypothetical protein
LQQGRFLSLVNFEQSVNAPVSAISRVCAVLLRLGLIPTQDEDSLRSPIWKYRLGDRDWRIIAEQASKEMDPEKLTRLVAELCRSLDEKNQKSEKTTRTAA